jgi:hypothetical protein
MGIQWARTSAFIVFKNVCDSVKREVLYNIFIEVIVPMKTGKLECEIWGYHGGGYEQYYFLWYEAT